MSTFTAVVLGLLIGWAIEWVIDWIYWRRRAATWRSQEKRLRERVDAAEARSADLEHQLALQKVNLVSLQEKLSYTEADLSAAKASLEAPAQQRAGEAVSIGVSAVPPEPIRAMPIVRDDLIVIKGIGPVIASKLNEAGIYSFADLAALTPDRLRALVGDVISRLADEDSIIEQAKQLAAEKSRGG